MLPRPQVTFACFWDPGDFGCQMKAPPSPLFPQGQGLPGAEDLAPERSSLGGDWQDPRATDWRREHLPSAVPPPAVALLPPWALLGRGFGSARPCVVTSQSAAAEPALSNRPGNDLQAAEAPADSSFSHHHCGGWACRGVGKTTEGDPVCPQGGCRRTKHGRQPER
jgi:hypothetical protein